MITRLGAESKESLSVEADDLARDVAAVSYLGAYLPYAHYDEESSCMYWRHSGGVDTVSDPIPSEVW